MSDPPGTPRKASIPSRKRPVMPLSPDNSFTSTSTSSSASILLSDAPTPNNTYFAGDAFTDISRHSRSEVIYEGPGDISLNPSLTPTSSRDRLSSYSSHHTGSYLLPTPLESITSSTDINIPHSTRPIPKPPLPLSSQNPTESLLSALPELSHGRSVSFGASDLEERGDRGGSNLGLKQEDVDSVRLQQLGYDAVLGREYTFWSSLAISWLNIGCLQVSLSKSKRAS
jgi:hypothetical protein